MNRIRTVLSALVCSLLLTSCLSLVRTPSIETVSSGDSLLISARTFYVVMTEQGSYKDTQSELMERNLQNRARLYFEKRGLTYEETTPPDIVVFVMIGLGKNPYGYYFPRVDMQVAKLDADKQPTLPIWSGYAQLRVSDRTVMEYYPELMDSLLERYPN